MQLSRQPDPRSNRAAAYEIKVKGAVDAHWSEWFNGLTLSEEPRTGGAPITTLRGWVRDQAALRGILNTLWDLNLTLLAVTPLTAEGQPEAGHDR